MPYLTYRRDMQNALKGFRGPAKTWLKLVFKITDKPLELTGHTAKFVVHGFLFSGKALFFTTRKVLNR